MLLTWARKSSHKKLTQWQTPRSPIKATWYGVKLSETNLISQRWKRKILRNPWKLCLKNYRWVNGLFSEIKKINDRYDKEIYSL